MWFFFKVTYQCFDTKGFAFSEALHNALHMLIAYAAHVHTLVTKRRPDTIWNVKHVGDVKGTVRILLVRDKYEI